MRLAAWWTAWARISAGTASSWPKSRGSELGRIDGSAGGGPNVPDDDFIISRGVEDEVGVAADRHDANRGALLELTAGAGKGHDEVGRLADAAFDGERSFGAPRRQVLCNVREIPGGARAVAQLHLRNRE